MSHVTNKFPLIGLRYTEMQKVDMINKKNNYNNLHIKYVTVNY